MPIFGSIRISPRFNPGQIAELGHTAEKCSPRPGIGLTIYRMGPPKIDSPRRIARIKTEDSKRNREFGCPAMTMFTYS